MPRLPEYGVQAVVEDADRFLRDMNAMGDSFNKTDKDLRDFSRHSQDATKDMGRMSKASNFLKNNWQSLLVVGGSLAGVAATIKQLFSAAEMGAQFEQTAESFETMLGIIGVAPGLLDELRIASRNTIDDQRLMTSTATLLAGAEDELAKALAEATPQLLEIAKASNKLNPALGSTAFLYESIATGVKRASPMILDNLGLTIRIGEANEMYADKLGKTSKELTTTEEKLALLNETLRAGDVLIQQVGGDTEAATDVYAEFGVEAQNVANLIKRRLNQALRPFVGFSTELAKAFVEGAENIIAYRRAMEEFGDVVESTDDDTVTLKNGMVLTNEEFILMAETATAAAKGMEGVSGTSLEAELRLKQLGESAREATGPVDPLASAMARLRDSAREVSDPLAGINTGLKGSIDRMQEMIDFVQTGGQDLVAAFEAIGEGIRRGMSLEQAEEMLEQLEFAELARQIDAGALTLEEAATQAAKEYGLEWGVALEKIEAAREQIFAIPDHIRSEIEIIVNARMGSEFRQFGGPALAGEPYVVGEGGLPELFVPAQSGTVVPMTAPSVHQDMSRHLNISGPMNFRRPMDQASFDLMIREWLGA